MNKRYAAPIVLALFFSAVTAYAASELFHHELSGPSTTASFPATLSSNCAGTISPSPDSFSTTSFSTIFQCSGGSAPVTCTTLSGQVTGICSDSAILSQSQGGSELTGNPGGYSDYNLYLVPHGSTIIVDCASITGGLVIFQSTSPPPSTGQPLNVDGASSPGLSYDYCADGSFSQSQGSTVFVSWF